MDNSFSADDYMSSNPVVFHPDTDIYEAIETLIRRKVSGGTVIDDNRRVVGIISEMDCLQAIVNFGYFREGGGKVKDFMSTDKIDFMGPHMNIVDAAQKMLLTKRRRLPVIEQDEFLGQISARSILEAFITAIQKQKTNENDKVTL